MKKLQQIVSEIISDDHTTPQIPSISIESVSPGHHFGPHHHEDIEVLSIFAGSCYFQIEDEPVRIRQHECLILFPDVPHSHYLKKNQSCHYINVHFSPGDITTCLTLPDLKDSLSFLYELKNHTTRFLKVTNDNFIRFISEQIHNEVKCPSELSGIKTKLHFCELYLHLSKIITDQYNITCKTENKYVKDALAFLQNHFTEDIEIDTLARSVGISSRQLSRLFQVELNSTILDYLIALRVKKAKHLLEYTTLPMTQIALSLGFNSSSYFATCFKKYLSLSPKEYRHSHSKAAVQQ